MELRRRVFDKIVAEHERTIADVQAAITGHDDLLADNPALARSVHNRFPYLEPLNHLQVDLAPQFERLLADSQTRRVGLVHGDWSPKNFLVWGDHVMAIDFEVIHYGDPAFDTGFLLNHLALKSFYRPESKDAYREAATQFWDAYTDGLPEAPDWMEDATIRHLGCLMLARIDGKSPAEYLIGDSLRGKVRDLAREMILHPPASVQEVFACL